MYKKARKCFGFFWDAVVQRNEQTICVSLQIHYLMILSANWAYLKSAVSTHEYQDIKTKDDQDLEAEARSKEGQNSSSYS